jgi:hypothetical protein
MITFTKDPDAVLDYSIDWNDWLVGGEKITSSTWIVPSGITQDSASATDYVTTIWFSGGTEGVTYRVTNRIVTDDGRTDDRSFNIQIFER